jgi:hypothetical protein
MQSAFLYGYPLLLVPYFAKLKTSWRVCHSIRYHIDVLQAVCDQVKKAEKLIIEVLSSAPSAPSHCRRYRLI